jgi:hypothetical protein
MKRFVVAGLVLIGLLLAVLIVVIAQELKGHRGPEVVLTNGTRVRLVKVGVGKCSYDSYTPLKAVLASITPNKYRHHWGDRVLFSSHSQPHEVGLIFELRTPEGRPKPELKQFLSRIEFIDSQGFVFKQNVGGYSSFGSGVMALNEGPFPRRDPMLHMRLYEQTTEKLLLDLHIPNPGYKPTFDVWAAEPLPATQTIAPLTVTLKHGPADIASDHPTEADFEITSTDPRWTTPKPSWNWWITDATGGTAYSLDGLSPFEPAWKFHLRLHRGADAEFGEDEVWRTKLLKLPGPLSLERLSEKGQAGGVEFVPAYLTSAGKVCDDGTSLTVTPLDDPSQSGRSSGTTFARGGQSLNFTSSSQPSFFLRHTQVDDETRLHISVTDQLGRKLSNEYGGVINHSGGMSSRHVEFQPLPDTTDVQLNVLVSKCRTFVFLVQPGKPPQSKTVP